MKSDSTSSSLIENGELVEKVDRHKLLGMVLDADLSYHDYTDEETWPSQTHWPILKAKTKADLL